jgi:hypothetical protein
LVTRILGVLSGAAPPPDGFVGDLTILVLLIVQCTAPLLALAHLHSGITNAVMQGLEVPQLSAQDLADLRDATATLLAMAAALDTIVAFAVRAVVAARSPSATHARCKPRHTVQPPGPTAGDDPFAPFAAGAVSLAPGLHASRRGSGHPISMVAPRPLSSLAMVGNACCVTAYIVSLTLNATVSHHPDASLFLCAPLLLLLTPTVTYSPPPWGAAPASAAPCVATWVALTAKAALHLMWARHASHLGGWYVMRNTLCLAVTAPGWVLFTRFLWGAGGGGGLLASGHSGSDVALLMATPAPLLAALLTDVPGVRLLAVGALLLGIAQQLASEKRRAAVARML